MNKSATKKSLYEAPLTSRLKTSTSTSSQVFNSFKYEIVIKTTENQVPDIQIIKGVDSYSKNKGADRGSAIKILMALEKRRLRQLRMGFYKMECRRQNFRQAKVCALKLANTLKRKQKELMRMMFLKLPNIKQLRLKQTTASKIIGLISSKILTRNKNYAFSKLKSSFVLSLTNKNQNSQTKSGTVATQKIKLKQQLSEPNNNLLSQKLTTLCKNSIKQPNKLHQSIQLAKKAFSEQLSKIEKKNNEDTKIVIIQYIIKLLGQIQNNNKNLLSKTLNSILPPAKQVNQANQQSKVFERIIETFNQCLNQENYQKWEKFVTTTQAKDNSCNKFFQKLDKLNDILSIKIQKAVQVETQKVIQIQQKLDIAIKQHEDVRQNLNKKIEQLQNELNWHLQQKITKKQYEEMMSASTANDRKVIAVHTKMQQLLKVVDDKNKDILKTVQHVQSIQRRLANIDGEQIKLTQKLNKVQNTIVGVKSSLKYGIEDEIIQLKKKMQQKDALLNNLTWELQSTKNSFLDQSAPKFQNSHNILGHFAELDLSDINVKQESERAKLQINELQKQLYNLRLENETLSQQLNKVKLAQPAINCVTSLENVVLLLTNILSFVNSKFNTTDSSQAVEYIFNSFSQFRLNYSENDQMFLEKCQNFSVDFIQQHMK